MYGLGLRVRTLDGIHRHVTNARGRIAAAGTATCPQEEYVSIHKSRQKCSSLAFDEESRETVLSAVDVWFVVGCSPSVLHCSFPSPVTRCHDGMWGKELGEVGEVT